MLLLCLLCLTLVAVCIVFTMVTISIIRCYGYLISELRLVVL
jgi:hypothetical protein